MIKVKVFPFDRNHVDEDFFREGDFSFPLILRERLATQGYSLSVNHEFESSEILLFFRFDFSIFIKLLFSRSFGKAVYVAMEPPVVRPLHAKVFLRHFAGFFCAIYTWQDELAGRPGFVKFNFPYTRKMAVQPISYSEKKLITCIVGRKNSFIPGELYSERLKAISFFQNNIGQEFCFYGVGWEGYKFSSWGGAVDNKLDIMSRYRFSICYENQRDIEGLISEKIFDSMLAGCVPVFWGASNVLRYIPATCFIDARQYGSYRELCDKLLSVTKDEYCDMLTAIEKFLSSDEYALFSPEDFACRLQVGFERVIASSKTNSIIGVGLILLAGSLVLDTLLRGTNKIYIFVKKIQKL